jgi:hypothetical protein
VLTSFAFINAAMHKNLVMCAKLGWEEYGRAEQAVISA